MRRLFLMLALANLVGLAGCGGSSSNRVNSGNGGGNGQVTLLSIAVNPTRATIAQGTTQAFTATGNYSDGSSKDLTATADWSCLLPNLASVSSANPTKGLATALPNVNGLVLITASTGGISNDAQLNITSATPTSLAVTPAAATIGFENQQQYTAIATFSDSSTQDVTAMTAWSGAPFITAGGLAIGTSLGTFNLSASFNGMQPTTPPTLTVDLSNLVSVAIAPASVVLPDHAQLKFSAIGTFNDGSTRDVSSLVTSWTAGDYSIATDFGSDPSVFKGAAIGGTTVNACLGTTDNPCLFNPAGTLTVSDATLQSIAVTPASATLAATTKTTYSATGTFSDGSTLDLSSVVSWSVQDGTGAATITGKGVLTASSPGTVTVNANSPFALGSVAGQGAVTVTGANLLSIAVVPETAFVVPGNNLAFTAVGTFDDGSTQDVSKTVSWTSLNSTTVASIASGVATALGVGQTTMTAKIGSVNGTGTLMVVSPSQLSLAIAPSAPAAFPAATSTQLTATATFTDGTEQNFTNLVNWSSSNANAATVGYQTGVVSGVAAGQSTITATVGSVSSSAPVTVQ